MKENAAKLFLFTLAIALVCVGLDSLETNVQIISGHWYFILSAMLGLSLLSERITSATVSKQPGDFHLVFIAVMGFRFLVTIFAVTIFLFVATEGKVEFALNVVVMHLMYLVFEIISVLSKLRDNSKTLSK